MLVTATFTLVLAVAVQLLRSQQTAAEPLWKTTLDTVLFIVIDSLYHLSQGFEILPLLADHTTSNSAIKQNGGTI